MLVRAVLGLWPYDVRYLKGAAATIAAVAALSALRAVSWQSSWLCVAAHAAVAVGRRSRGRLPSCSVMTTRAARRRLRARR